MVISKQFIIKIMSRNFDIPFLHHLGLAAGILTNDINTALKFAQAVEAGSVWYETLTGCLTALIIDIHFYRVNCYDATMPQTPFGGFKMSGQGREL